MERSACRERAARKQEGGRDDQRLGAHCPQVPVTADVGDRRLARPGGLAPRYREGQPQPGQQRGLDRGRGGVVLRPLPHGPVQFEPPDVKVVMSGFLQRSRQAELELAIAGAERDHVDRGP